MNTLRDLVRNLAVIVLLAAFMEMLLPAGNMRRFVKMVMGLFIIITLLNPIMTILHQEPSFEVTAWQSAAPVSLNSILQNGQQISAAAREAASQEYRQRLGRQMLALAQLVKGIEITQVEVTTEEERPEVPLGQIRDVTVWARKANPNRPQDKGAQITGPQPVVIGPPATTPVITGSGWMDESRKAICQTLADFYALRPEQIKVIFLED